MSESEREARYNLSQANHKMKQAQVEHTTTMKQATTATDNEKRQQRMIIDIALPFLQAAKSTSTSASEVQSACFACLLLLGSWNCRSASASGLVCCVLFTSAETEIQAKQTSQTATTTTTATTNSPQMIANFAVDVAACVTVHELHVALSSSSLVAVFFSSTLSAAYQHWHTFKHRYTQTLTFYARLLLWLLLFCRLHTHFYAVLSLLAHSLSYNVFSFSLCLLLPAVGSANVFAFGLFVATLWVLLQLPLLLCCLDM